MNIMLSNTRLFRGIGSDELPLLLQCLGAAQKHYDRGETILAEGAPTEQLGMVLTGIFASRGANFVSDLVGRLRGQKTSEQTDA